MSEPHPVYEVATPDPRIVMCTTCGEWIGALVDVDGQEWLHVGGITVRAMHGVCSYCGAPFHWTVAERMLAELTRRVLEARHG